MQKLRLLFVALLVSMAWQVQSAPLTPQVAADDATDEIWAPDFEVPLVFYAEQMSVNALQYGDGGGLEALIDGDPGTWFHSSYSATGTITDEDGNSKTVENIYPAEKHWIQFDLEEPQSSIFFTFVIRNSAYNDTPDDITFLVTNTPEDAKSWVEAAHLTNMFSNYSSTSQMAGREYTSPRIAFGEPYRYLRMVVNRTFSQRTEGTYEQYFWNMAEMQLYPARLVTDPQERLNIVLEEYLPLGMEMYGIEDEFKGDTPGFYGADEVDAFMAAFDRAIIAADAVKPPTEAEVDEIIEALRTTYAALLASQIKVGTGYYRLINSNDAYYVNQGVEKAMVASADGKWLKWGTYSPDDLSAIWRFTLLDNGNFTIQNMASLTYINYIGETSSHVPMTEEQTTEQIVSSSKMGQFTIYNTQYNVPYHTESHNLGAGVEGYIVPWGSADEPNSVWYIYEVSEEELARVQEINDDVRIQADYKKAVADAEVVMLTTIEYATDNDNPYITNVNSDANLPEESQLWTNALETREGSLEALIDDNINSYFHSAYSYTVDEIHCLYADLGKAVDKFVFTLMPRQSGYLDIPADVIIYGSNDITNWEDESAWTEVKHLASGFPEKASTSYTSPGILMDKPYRYLRFQVLNTFSERYVTNSFGEVRHYFTLSEFQIYPCEFDEAHSQYYNVEGMKDAVDALRKLINDLAVKPKITRPDVTALEEAVQAVKDLYVDHGKLADDLAVLIDEAERVVFKTTTPVKGLLTNASQFSANSVIQEGNFGNLLDENIDTYFHTNYSYGAIVPGTSEYDPDEVRYGATHNLQVDMLEPQNTIRIRFTPRNSGYRDWPVDIVIYATNDVNLGADPLSEDSEWEQVAAFTEGFPTAINEWTSEEFDAGGNRYLRMVVNDTYSHKNEGNRLDPRGMPYFTLSEFQVMISVSMDDIQYSYVPDVKKWTDRLSALIAENKNKDKYEVWQRDIDAFTEALAMLDSSFVHNDALMAAVSQARDMVEHAAVGTDFGYVPSQDIINTLEAAANAAYDVAHGRTLQPQMDAEVTKVEDAMKTFVSKVKMPEMNHWYNIVNSAKTSESISYDDDGNEVVTIIHGYCSGKAIATKDFAIGDPISFGYYDLEFDDATYGDAANAFWRFVPIEGTEFVGIQNMATGHYIGATTIQGDGDGRPVQTNEPAPYLIKYYGAGEILFYSQDSLNVNGRNVPLHAQERNGAPLVGWPVEHGNASCWTLKEVLDTQILTLPAKLNTVSIMSLPFAISEDQNLAHLNADDAHTYALSAIVANDDGTTSLELVEKQALEAGEAFVLTYGDFEDPTAEQLDEPIFIPRPTDVDPLASVDANGLISAIGGIDLEEEGLGYLRNNKVVATTSRGITIPGLSGYIRASLCQPTGETPDLVLVCGSQLSDAIEVIAVERPVKDGTVYDLSGRRVTKPLRGLYIQNGRKFLVK